ncbi:MAG: class I SAM-dependent methyltransferase [Nanoarchaeota archaeon]
MVFVKSKKGYDLWADKYTGIWVESFEQNHLIEMLGNIKGKTALDAGCGAGRNIIKLVHKGAKVTGIDISPKIIFEAQQKLHKKKIDAPLFVGNLTKLQFPNETFDIIIASSVLDHIKNLKPVFKEFERVLKKKGVLLYSGLHPNADVWLHAAQFTKNNTQYLLEEYPHSFEEIKQLVCKNFLVQTKAIILRLSNKQRMFYPKRIFEKERNKPVYMILKFEKKDL